MRVSRSVIVAENLLPPPRDDVLVARAWGANRYLSARARRRNFGNPATTLSKRKSVAKKEVVAAGRVSLWVATRKGMWQIQSDEARRKWRLVGPPAKHVLGA